MTPPAVAMKETCFPKAFAMFMEVSGEKKYVIDGRMDRKAVRW